VGRPRRTLPRALLLPGIDGSGRLFAPLLRAEPRGLVPEVLSFPPDRELGYDDLVARVRERLPRGRFALVAESFSGPIAVRIAAERPPGLVALVLAATFLHEPVSPLLHPIRGLFGARLFGLGMPAPLVRHFMAGPDAPRAIVSEVQAAVAAVSPKVMAHRAAEALRADVREAFARVRAPVLWLSPTRDRLLSTSAAEEALEIRPDVEVARIEAPHMILQRCPHASLARIEELMTRARTRDLAARQRGKGTGTSRRSGFVSR
jgi:pimeloyl-[acyl-carrier protein] methyl ester esterase